MADLAVTATSVLPGTGTIVSGTLGGTATAGQLVRLNTSNQYVTAQSTSAANSQMAGVALNGGAINQPVQVQTTGTYTAGGTVLVGKVYIVSATAGGIAPVDDVAGGEFIRVFGVGISATVIQMIDTPYTGVAAAGAVA